MIVFLKGYVTAAQALGSLVNKLDLKTSETEYSGGCTFEEAMDKSFGNLCLGAANNGLLKICSIVGLTWIGKGLLLRRARDINRQAKDGGLKIWQN
ncbi:hypothetical protein POTOM_040636 [Populus tomentosa]|uniref:Uncharacterized protein n=1 Tax=Populus tomentosa TaxID=118781 RepID=A0A8X7YKE5_POPTO|nr:hypothetical protein POTOM_040636 [Populus tomentosa]